MKTYKELINDYRKPNLADYPHFENDELFKIEASVNIENVRFDIDERVAKIAGISLETFQKLDPDALNITVREIIPELIREEQGPDSVKVLERMAKFSEQVRKRGAQYYLFGEDDMIAGDTKVEWVNEEKTQIKVTTRLLGINDTAWIDLPLTTYPESTPLTEALKPSQAEFEGDFDIIDVYM